MTTETETTEATDTESVPRKGGALRVCRGLFYVATGVMYLLAGQEYLDKGLDTLRGRKAKTSPCLDCG